MKIYIKDCVLVVNFEGKKDNMNKVLDPLSNAYEGPLKNREGHNFPSQYITSNHCLFKYKNDCKYVIGCYNSKSIQHEFLHAKFYIDEAYRNKIIKEWDALDDSKRTHITSFLKRLGYSDKVIIDEYQAYRYTEAKNFFGIKLD